MAPSSGSASMATGMQAGVRAGTAPVVIPTPASVAARLATTDSDADIPVVLRHALRWAVAHADVELVSYLTTLEGGPARLLDAEVAVLEDDDGWGVVGMAIQSSCGRSEKEEAVRLVVGRWGVAAGPRGGRDRSGWTPLHLAALLSSPQTVSVLLNRGASLTAINDAGFTAFDLVTGMEGRENLALLLDPVAGAVAGSAPPTPASASFDHAPRISAERAAQIERRRVRLATRAQRAERRAERERVAAERERWVRDRAKHIGVDAGVLFDPAADELSDDEGGDEEGDAEEMEVDEALGGLQDEVMSKVDMDASLLVFSLHQLPTLLDVLVTSYRPVCQPRNRRSLPANALYLYARFAHYRCDELWLEELLWGAVEAIESVVYGNSEDLASLAFWEYNLTLLLYLLRSDDDLREACLRGDGLLNNFEELINAIHVFIIRIAERKIDIILEPAMLDFESLEDFDDVRFADEWNIFRSFGKKAKRETPLAAAMFSPPGSPAGKSAARESPMRPQTPTGSRGMNRPTSIQDLRATAAAARAEAKEVIAHGIGKAQAVFGDKPSPRKVADILTSVLLILQLYEVNPAFNVQVFSQVFFWISSELFNRIITRRKYLCRTKAVQIRMNITALEDWTRSNGLPPHIATRHFVPIMQLLQWLQCASQTSDFDMLIGTVQNLRSLNPLQMRRAVRDYRYEVNEGRMSDDCNQYLQQLVRDWERRRVNAQMETDDAHDQDAMPIEALFDGSVSLADWIPQTGPESIGELLDSRYMLPFLVPEGNDYLLATPPGDAAFRNLMTEKPLLPDGSIPSRPLSTASCSSTRPLGWVAPTRDEIQRLPDDFFSWLKNRQNEARKEANRQSTLDKPLPPPPAAHATPARPDSLSPGSNQSTPLATLAEDREVTPLADSPMLQRFQAAGGHVGPATPAKPSAGHAPELARRASQELATPDRPVHARENIELLSQSSNGSLYNAYAYGSSNGASAAASAHGSPHYELARHRRENSSISSLGSVRSVDSGGSSSSEKKQKRWWPQPRIVSDDIPLQRLKEMRAERQDSSDTIKPVRL